MKKYLFLSLVGIIFFSSSCRHDTDLSQLKAASYSSDIQPIISGNCTQSGCHSDGNGGHGEDHFSLTTYDGVMNFGEIKAGDAHGSKLYKAISNHGFENIMPPSPLPMLSDDQIKMIYIWIEQGAKNN